MEAGGSQGQAEDPRGARKRAMPDAEGKAFPHWDLGAALIPGQECGPITGQGKRGFVMTRRIDESP